MNNGHTIKIENGAPYDVFLSADLDFPRELIAAGGMVIAVVATLLTPGVWDGSGTPVFIIVGLAIGTAIGMPAAAGLVITAIDRVVSLVALAILATVVIVLERRHRARLPEPDAGGSGTAEPPPEPSP